ncbi:PAS domain-containing protein [Chlorogloeopsis sp. ULAP02]|uniref:PAS domain-containing protein n=1 Tax=Chlorogloeopsis sp. ULAP02 TaxID=3107926 RepID=UPI003135ED7B
MVAWPQSQLIQSCLAILPPDIPVETAVKVMNRRKTSYVLVCEQRQLVGIFTEQDLVGAIASGVNLSIATLLEVMTDQVITIKESELDNLFNILSLLRYHKICYLPIVDEKEQLAGVITLESILEALQHIETHLKQAELQYRNLVEQIPGVAYTSPITATSEFAYISPQIQKFLGIPDQEWNSGFFNSWAELVHLEDRDRIQQEVAAAIATGKPFCSEYRMIRHDGRTIWVQDQAKLALATDGQTTVLQGIAFDISDRKQQEEALQQSQARYQSILEDQTEMVARFLPDSTILFVNQAFCRYFGIERQDILGKSYKPVIYEEDRDRVTQLLESMSIENPTIMIENRVIDGKGEIRWTQWVNRMLFDDGGNVIECQSVGRDITQLKLTEAALRQSEERLQLALEASGDGIWGWNLAAGEVYLSSRWIEMLGYAADEFPAEFSSWEKSIHPDDKPWVMDVLQAHLKDSSVPYTFEYRMRTKSGEWKWIANYGKVVVRDQDAQPLRMAGIHRDIDDRKQAEQALKEREAFLRAIGDNIPNSYIYQVVREVDGNYRFYYFSAGVEKAHGLKPEAILADPSLLYSTLVPEDLLYVSQKQEESAQTMSVFDVQVREYSPEGNIRWARLCSTPRAMDDGRIIWDGVRFDITELKRTEETLRKSKALLTEAQKVARIGNWEFDVATKKITWTEELFYILNRDLLQKEPTYLEHLQLYHPDDREKLHKVFERAITTGESYKLTLRLNPQSDSSIRYIEGIGYADFNTDGQVIRLYGTTQDVTERVQTEKALQEKEQFLRSIYNGVEQAIFVVDVIEDGDFKLVGFNPACERFTNMRSAEIQGKSLQQMFPPEIAASVRQRYQACQEAGKVITYEECLPFLGLDTWWITNLAPLWDERSRIYRIVGSSINISERKRLELALEASENHLKNILTTANASIVSFRVFANRDWEYEYQSIGCESLFGYTAAEILTDKMLWISRVFPEDRDTLIYPHFESIFAERTFAVEYRFHHKDGSLRWISAIYSSHLDKVANCWIVTGVSIDISDRKRAEEALQQSETLFRTLSESAPVGIFRTDAQGNNTYSNPRCQAICGFTFEEALKDGWMQFIHPEDLEVVFPQWILFLTTNQEFYAQVRFVHRDATIRFCRLMAVPIFSESGELMGNVGTVEDITESRAIAKMKNEFISIVSHELRTPLASIRGSLGLLAAGVLKDQPESAQQMLEIASSETERLVRLVNDILDLERLESNKVTLVKQWCDVTKILRQSTETVQPLAAENNIALVMLPSSVQIWVDPDRIIQTLVNLVGNAIKFSPSHSKVTVSAEYLTDQVLFKVQDQGRGIPDSKLETIFERFQQVDATDSRQKGGTGLGLAICKSIVQQHGGKIWVESILEKGSIFYFTIPKVVEG